MRVEVGVDSIPADDADTGAETYLLELQQGRMAWKPYEANEGRTANYFRCADVPTDLYQVE